MFWKIILFTYILIDFIKQTVLGVILPAFEMVFVEELFLL